MANPMNDIDQALVNTKQFKNAIDSLPPELRSRVNATAAIIRQIVAHRGIGSKLAVCLVATEIGLESMQEIKAEGN